MVSIVANSVIFLCTIASISQIITFCSTYKQTDIKLARFVLLGLSLALGCCCNVAMFITYGTKACYIFYAVDRFARTLFMAELVLVSEDIINISGKYVSIFVSAICYASAMLYFVDTLISGGVLEKSQCGVYFEPQTALHQMLYFAFYMIYIVAMLVFVVSRASYVNKRKDRFELILMFVSFGISSFGFLAELLVTIYSLSYFPICVICNLAALYFMQRLIQYHRSILLLEEDYDKELSPNRTDAVFILDDALKVVFINKRAQILSSIFHDEYIGRRFTDIFDFTDDKIKELKSTEDHAPFGMSADYIAQERPVNMVVRHAYDRFGEILSTCIVVYNMEDREQYTDTAGISQTLTEDDKKEIFETAAITKGARILVADEDLIFQRDFLNVLKPYEVLVTRALNCRDALQSAEQEEFDLIFVSENMINISAMELSARIRSMPGEYYSKVPIIFITSNDINDVFAEFLGAGFTDYLYKPIEIKQVNSVLTRWAWQRLSRDAVSNFDITAERMAQMHMLLEDADNFLKSGSLDKLSYCIRGIKRGGINLGLSAVPDMAREIEEACLFEEKDHIGEMLTKLSLCINEDS